MTKCAICQKNIEKNANVCSDCINRYPPNFIYERTFAHITKNAENKKITIPDSRRIADSFIEHISRKLKKGDKILDIGCGRGYLSNLFQKRGFKVIALDFSRLNVDFYHKFGLEALCANAESLPFNEESFDLVYSNDLIEHLFNPDKHFQEVFRILNNGGHYIIKKPNRLFDEIYYRFIIRKKDFQFFHPSTLFFHQIKKKMAKAGLEVKINNLGDITASQFEKISKILCSILFKFVFKKRTA
jgi:SAM-dependent methyltransferase